jgi:hypothetical protein
MTSHGLAFLPLDRYLGLHQQMILAGLWFAMSTGEMAEAFTCSEPTILRARRKTMEEVFDFTKLGGTPELLRLWAELHRKCCTVAAQEMIGNSQLMTDW